MEMLTPPLEGINGWLVGLAITSVISICANIWREYRLQAERNDKNKTTLALENVKIVSDQNGRELERWNTLFDRVVLMNDKLQTSNQLIIQTNNEQTRKIHELMESLEETNIQLDRKDSQIMALNTRVEQLEREVKVLEVANDNRNKDQHNT